MATSTVLLSLVAIVSGGAGALGLISVLNGDAEKSPMLVLARGDFITASWRSRCRGLWTVRCKGFLGGVWRKEMGLVASMLGILRRI